MVNTIFIFSSKNMQHWILIHADGDENQGDWVDDKVNGWDSICIFMARHIKDISKMINRMVAH